MTEALPQLSPEHRERVIAALDIIKAAQNRLIDAAELLSPISGFPDEWHAVRNLAATVKEQWKAVDATLRLLDASSPSTFVGLESVSNGSWMRLVFPVTTSWSGLPYFRGQPATAGVRPSKERRESRPDA